jgi:nanoRNase/pAp phosphatase (c-di-AMP/oligoRNAs hydrolase)
MTSRLVLGAGPLVRSLLDDLAADRGEVRVLTADEHRVDTLRGDDVTVQQADPADREVLSALQFSPDTVFVAVGEPEENATVARAVRSVFPAAMLVVYSGMETDPAVAERLDLVADRVVDPRAAITDHLFERVGESGVRIRQLQRVLRDVDGTLAVVMHDNPDPDAIASGVALARLAEAVGCETEICYFGEITHQENRAFVNLLEFDLTNLEAGADLSGYGGFALVDHSRPGVNDQLPAETPIDIVVDHHPPRAPIEARFVDLRSDVGATSTLLVDYLRRFDSLIDESVATGLLFGISVDTHEFRREVSADDFEAAAFLLPHANLDVLQRIEDPSMSADTLNTIGRAIANRRQEGSVLLSCVGELTDRDALAQAADRLLDLEDVNSTLVYGVKDGTIYASARARGTDVDLGEVLREAFGQIGSAGGHADMAGAQITLGVLESIEDRDESLHEVVRSVVDDRFMDALQARPNHLLSTAFPSRRYDSDEFLDIETDGE